MFGQIRNCGANRCKKTKNKTITSIQICMHEPEVAPAVVNQCENIFTQQQLVMLTLETSSHCYSNLMNLHVTGNYTNLSRFSC